MICKNCGHRISGAALFCPYCGRNNRTGEMPKDTEKPSIQEENTFLAQPMADQEAETHVPVEYKPETAAAQTQETEEKSSQASTITAVMEPPTVSKTAEESPSASVYPGSFVSPMTYENYQRAYQQNKANNKAVASLVLGIISALIWAFPFLGLPITILGIVLGAQARKQGLQNTGMATAGMILSIIFLVLTCLVLMLYLVVNLWGFHSAISF